MTAEYPTHELTTYELRDRKEALEDALQTLPDGSPARTKLEEALGEVRREEAERRDFATHAERLNNCLSPR